MTCFLLPTQGGGCIGGHVAWEIRISPLEIGRELNLDPIQEIHIFRHFCRRRAQAKWRKWPATRFLVPIQGGGGMGGHTARKICTSPPEIDYELNLDPIQKP